MRTSPAGIELIKDFEGLRLEAYPDPGTGGDPWTIGYGHTGPEAQPGLTISIEQAGSLFKEDLRKFEEAVDKLITVEINQHEFDALVSFTYNCGWFALEDSTLRKRLNAGEKKGPVFKEELPKWVNGGNGPMPGLVRRRDAEVELACTPVGSGSLPKSFLEDAATYHEGLPHQVAAWRMLESNLAPELLEAFKSAYRSRKEEESKEPVASKPKSFPLDVPYYDQNDSATEHGHRMCFSSSMTMALDYIDPDKIEGDDDWYLNVVFQYGDTVSAEAQMAAAHSLGFEAEMLYNGSQADLEALLDKGVPVPIGVLHKGPVDSPTGGGHWICLTGHDSTHFYVNDPAGDMDLVNGGYPAWNSGEQLRYSKKNLMKRWLIANDHDGWYMDLSNNF